MYFVEQENHLKAYVQDSGSRARHKGGSEGEVAGRPALAEKRRRPVESKAQASDITTGRPIALLEELTLPEEEGSDEQQTHASVYGRL